MQVATKKRKVVQCRCSSGLYCRKHYIYATTDYKYSTGRDRESHDQACGGGVRIIRKRIGSE